MKWSVRTGTREAHKLPLRWVDECFEHFLRMAYTVKEYNIPEAMIVNTDQTQLVYAPGGKLTWAQTGSKQVSIVGLEEKRALTIVVSISASGVFLPIQSIHQGSSSQSLPKPACKSFEESKAAGFRFEPSKTKTYWSTLDTMKLLVTHIIAPYMNAQRSQLGLPGWQKGIWEIDAWSVHRSEAFRQWMKDEFPNILIRYIPAGCTGVFQPCDVGIQRILKHSLKRSYHRDVVENILEQLDDGKEQIEVVKSLPILRDMAVRWVWDAFEALNKPDIVKKVGCRILLYERIGLLTFYHPGI